MARAAEEAAAPGPDVEAARAVPDGATVSVTLTQARLFPRPYTIAHMYRGRGGGGKGGITSN
jgi:hypothetical protein